MANTLENLSKQKPEQNAPSTPSLIRKAIERVSLLFKEKMPTTQERQARAKTFLRHIGSTAIADFQRVPANLSRAKQFIGEGAKAMQESATQKYTQARERAVATGQNIHKTIAENEAYREKAFRERPAFDSTAFNEERWAALGKKNAEAHQREVQNEAATDYLLDSEAAALRHAIGQGHLHPETVPSYPKAAVKSSLGGIALRFFSPGRTKK